MYRALVYAVALCCCLWLVNAQESRPYYTAAVYEHQRLGSPDTDSANFIIERNLDYYKRAAETAKSKESDVIIFPEYGIFPPGNRTELKKYLEHIPDPRTGRINPCEEPDNYEDRPILYTLSCMAKDNCIVVVANTGDIQNCTEEEEDCPSDGVFHFNTNVVFDGTGTMVLKYHKEHLFFELGMDLAREQQNTTFETDFGTFATYICFDIDFARIGEVGRQPEVEAILFSTMWIDTFPQSMSVQFFQSWALGNDVTLLAANIQLPGAFAVGSGLFHGQNGAIAYTYNPDGISKLVVANVPRKGFPAVPANDSITAIEANDTFEYENDGDAVPLDCSRILLNNSVDIYHDYRCLEANMVNYTFVKLTDASGHVEACNNGMCCSLTYTSSGFGDEEFYLGVFNGTYDTFDRYFWCEEDCFLSRCDAHGDVPCAVFPMKSNTVFHDVYIRAKFSTAFVYPQVVGSGMRLLPRTDWHSHSSDSTHDPHSEHPHFEHPEHHADYKMGEMSVHFENKPGKSLISFGMNGRCFDRDPPYTR